VEDPYQCAASNRVWRNGTNARSSALGFLACPTSRQMMRVIPMLLIRRAGLGELPKLAQIERSAASLFREAGLAWIADGDTMPPDLLDTMCRAGTVWVAVDDTGEPVGFLAAHTLDEQFHVAEVSVARPAQRRGVGAALIAAAADHARTQNFRGLTLTTYRDLPWNGPYYSVLGFVEVNALDAGPGHRRKLRTEAEAGHDTSRRCVMAKALGKVDGATGIAVPE
jgi:GNAT superfamily N-acetyltransferase